ncbi:unnamed protein product [Schistosoma margrebowiei]|uniref:Uncharacterized protein n=1 Tax=Schistosoma margrebowiei TaxID=48269 RepID=A0A183M0S2_9TREM|nr:unnamed protein product [Schistosoma margrebowiei]
MQLHDLDFADDLALLSQSQQQMHEKTTSVAAASATRQPTVGDNKSDPSGGRNQEEALEVDRTHIEKSTQLSHKTSLVGDPCSIVSNGNDWFTDIGCRHLLTAPRQPQSDRLGKKCVPTLECAAASANLNDPEELEKRIDNVLVQHRNAEHLRNNDGPAYLFKYSILLTHSVNET